MVRQMEEDERMARELQDEFNGEVRIGGLLVAENDENFDYEHNNRNNDARATIRV